MVTRSQDSLTLFLENAKPIVRWGRKSTGLVLRDSRVALEMRVRFYNFPSIGAFSSLGLTLIYLICAVLHTGVFRKAPSYGFQGPNNPESLIHFKYISHFSKRRET